MNRRVLLVDDEPNVLHGFERLLRKDFEMVTALGPEPGLEAIREQGPFAAVVSDLRMAGMDGNQFLAQVRQLAPDTVRIMLTGQADLSAAIQAVNQGNIFRFLLKPCPRESMQQALQAALEQYRLVMAERELLEKTLNGAIQVLTEILGLVNPVAFSRAHRIKGYVSHMAARLGLEQAWRFELAAMLSQIGYITVPPDVLLKLASSEALSDNERELVAGHPRVARRLLENVPRLEDISAMIAGQSGDPAEGSSLVAMGSALLRAANDFDELVVAGSSRSEAASELERRSAGYDPKLLEALESVPIDSETRIARMLTVEQLQTGMVINQDVRAKNGTLLLSSGQLVTMTAVARLQGFARTVGIVEPFSVLAPQA
ncbi:MAG: response regulator [Acidobacteriia bacterium]|nr:response regulator [Terriglobia bacterium]